MLHPMARAASSTYQNRVYEDLCAPQFAENAIIAKGSASLLDLQAAVDLLSARQYVASKTPDSRHALQSLPREPQGHLCRDLTSRMANPDELGKRFVI